MVEDKLSLSLAHSNQTHGGGSSPSNLIRTKALKRTHSRSSKMATNNQVSTHVHSERSDSSNFLSPSHTKALKRTRPPSRKTPCTNTNHQLTPTLITEILSFPLRILPNVIVY